jgi:hypothetical protein
LPFIMISIGYGLDGLGSIPGMARCLFSSQRPDRLYGPPSLLSNGYLEHKGDYSSLSSAEVLHSPLMSSYSRA